MANRHLFYTDSDTDSYYNDYSPRTQIPEESFHGPYSRSELENARTSLLNNVLSATGGIWYRLKYKLGMCNFNEGAGFKREEMRQCMFDMHSSVWCQSPLNEKRLTMALPPVGRKVDEITSTNNKLGYAGSGSSRGNSRENNNSKIVVLDSDEDTNELNVRSPRYSAMSKRQEEIVIDTDSEPEYPNIAFLYEN